MRDWIISGGSVRGTDHHTSFKNNHDSLCWNEVEDAAIAVVCDGCGSGEHSEVGAKIGAKLIVQLISKHLKLNADDPASLLETVRNEALYRIELIASAMGPLEEIVSDFFLFTVMGVIIHNDEVILFRLGDGFWGVNGKYESVSYMNNAPPYLAYGIFPSFADGVRDGSLKFHLQERLPELEVRNILIGTDGVEELKEAMGTFHEEGTEQGQGISHFFQDKFFSNPYLINRQLNQLNKEQVRPDWGNHVLRREKGKLRDDTTFIVLKHKNSAGEDR